jgi:hypothetical protein
MRRLRHSFGLLGALGLLLATTACLTPAPASASVGHVFKETFGSVEQPSFASASTVATDQSTGDVYVMDGRDEEQLIRVEATAGKFKLKVGANVTGEFNFNTVGPEVQTALRSAACGGAPCLGIEGFAFGSFFFNSVRFMGSLGATDVPTIQCENGTPPLSGGEGCVVITRIGGVEGRIARFHADGSPAPFSALGSNLINGREGPDQTPRPGLENSFGTQLAIDNSGGPGEGDVYLTQPGEKAVDIFASNGSYLGKLSQFKQGPNAEGALTPFVGALRGVAVDSSGAVYVSDEGGEIHKFAPSGSPALDSDNVANFSIQSPLTLAAGIGPSAGSIFAVQASGGRFLRKLDADDGTLQYTVTAGGPPTEYGTVATDPATGQVYGARPSGDLIDDFDASGPTEAKKLDTFTSSNATGIAIRGASAKVYVARRELDSGNGAPPAPVDVWETVILPVATTEAASEVTSETALLHGTVSADGGPQASCEFQYITKAQTDANLTAKAPEFEGASSVLCSPAGPFTGTASHAVSAEVTGLGGGTPYRFRLLASNEQGSQPGDALSFRSAGPQIVSESVQAVGVGDVTLSAEINPQGATSTYRVEYGPTTAYGQSSASALVGFAGDESIHTVSVNIAGLSPATAYHFRFAATNAEGSGKGGDLSLSTYPAPPSFGPCANDALRTGFGAHLPDCRAYEQASPVDKHGANIQGSYNATQAASGGNRIDFFLNGGLATSGGSSGLSAYLASRGPGGWSTDGLAPSTEADQGLAAVVGWSEDMATTAVTAPVPGGSAEALYLRDSDTGVFSFGPLLPGGGNFFLAGYAADTQHLIFESEAPLLPGAVAGKTNLYDLNHGDLTLPGRIPTGGASACDDEGAPACAPALEGSVGGAYPWAGAPSASFCAGGATCGYYAQSAISHDGSKVFFTATDSRQLYLRENGTATTQISASQRSTPDPNGEKPAAFMGATPDGSKVFFAGCEKLTEDSTAVSTGANTCTDASQGQDLYSYDTATGELSDLATDPEASDLEGAAVQGVLGYSDDGSYVYFVANGVLAPGALPGNCASNGGGTCNLYISHDGVTTFVTTLRGRESEDAIDWKPFGTGASVPKSARVSADGHTLLFSSTRSLTGYDNALPPSATRNCSGGPGVSGSERCAQLFRYSAPGEELTCVSCNPTGAPPTGRARLATDRGFTHDSMRQYFLTRNLSADGNRVFFDSPDPLLGTDTNGVADPYEWETQGSGTCHTPGGCLYLLSSGTSPDPSYFGDASLNGDDAFIFTTQQLVPSDKDQLNDVYDAVVGGGLASQHELAPPTCAGVACQANPAPPPDSSLASASFQGPGNAHKPPSARKCPKGKRGVRSNGKARCVKKQSKQHKRHSNRGGLK